MAFLKVCLKSDLLYSLQKIFIPKNVANSK